MEQMTFLDFFAGIGGFRKGFELCGMRCVGHCEIDKYADRSYRAIHDVKEDEWYAADITKVAPADLPRADLWAGGFPCQDISVAGRQRGLDGARSGLFFTLAQLVKGQSPENRPTWIVLENVKNLLSIHGGWDFATVLDTLASLGYHITMAFLLIGNIPLLYFLNKDWYDVLVNTGFGKGILAVCLLVLLISFAAVIRLTKPVEYKR